MVVPPKSTWTTPPCTHISLQLLSTAGMLPIITVGTPGIHGPGKTGVQTPGVRTPSAAAVWAAVGGFGSIVQTPKGKMFTIGLLSMMFAAGLPPIVTRFVGSTTSDDGAAPAEHWSIAPWTTGMAIGRTVPARGGREQATSPA